jgi:hypothetical protein
MSSVERCSPCTAGELAHEVRAAARPRAATDLALDGADVIARASPWLDTLPSTVNRDRRSEAP